MGVDASATYGEATPVAPTPNLDALAAAGVLFRNAWAEPLCSPFRAAVITGRNPSDNGIGHGINPTDPDRTFILPTSTSNLAALLSTAGYRTAAVGKAHLAAEPGVGYPQILDSSITATETHMNDLGFDYYSGFVFGGRDYFDWPHTTNGVTVSTTDYATSVIADEALAQLSGAEPFFLWLAFTAPHAPQHEPPHALLADPSIYNGFATVRDKFRAMIEAMDTELGRVLAAVDLSDTTVIFVGDNGTTGAVINSPLPSDHAKGTVYEGGLNVPLLVAGQAVSLSAVGAESDALVQPTDLFTTILEIAGVTPPARPDSVSFAPQLQAPASPSVRSTVFAELFIPNGGPVDPASHLRAAREARYKLVRRGLDPDELYDLDVDPIELSPLDLGALTPDQTDAYDRLQQAIALRQTSTPVVPATSFGGIG